MPYELEAESYYRYAQSLKSIGEHQKAFNILEQFNLKTRANTSDKVVEEKQNYVGQIKANSGRYKIENSGVNSKYSDYGSSFYNDSLVFASTRHEGSLGQREQKSKSNDFTNLYVTALDKDLLPGKTTLFPKIINSKYHESTPVFTKDGKTMYFTRNNYLDGKKGKDKNNITLIKIYKATFKDNQWVNVTELPFDSDQYSTGHPALSPDEKILYFSSDMPGTLGLSDLYKVQINEDGSFGVPENLGTSINTQAKETFPFVTDENELYFASDGHTGIGGLDIFVSKINDDGTFTEVQNVGDGVNSKNDDFAFLIDTKTRRGFFTSNREGGLGDDDIYKFIETKKRACQQEIFGIVTDLFTKQTLPNQKITLFDSKFNLISTTNSDDNGYYFFALACGETYNIRSEKQGYATIEINFETIQDNGKTNLPLDFHKLIIGDNLAQYIGIETIYFGLNKSNITDEAASNLEKILDVLKKNPTMKLDIRSHTDSRETFRYNEILSSKRAKATVKWLVKKGINNNRLTGKGYGQTQLVNKCGDGVWCPEKEHQQNRRSEFIITAL
jgi:outer membrane protein OmpA-like peptidoglycan-associated protein